MSTLRRHEKFESQSRSNISGGASTIIAHPMGLEETCSEPGAAFIYKLLKLSANSECLGYLLAHMGLSKFFKRFLLYARASGVSEEMRINMGILINNLFGVTTTRVCKIRTRVCNDYNVCR